MKCPYCLSLDQDEFYCRQCGKQLYRVQKRRLFFAFLIFFLLIAILILFITLYEFEMTIDQEFVDEVPYIEDVVITEPEKIVRQECGVKDFEYSRVWLGINNYGAFSKPYLEITNLENRWGKFEVNFTFFDGSKYNYSLYKDREYEEFKDELSRDQADMQSPNLEYWIGPGETETISFQARKKDLYVDYWSLASVTVPKMDYCRTFETSNNITQRKQVVKYKEEIKVRRVSTAMTLSELLPDFNMFEIMMLTIPVFVMLYLLWRISSQLSKNI